MIADGRFCNRLLFEEVSRNDRPTLSTRAGSQAHVLRRYKVVIDPKAVLVELTDRRIGTGKGFL